MDLNDAGKWLEELGKFVNSQPRHGYKVITSDLQKLLTLAKAGLELATDLGRVAVHAEDAQTRSVARGLNLKYLAALKSTEAK